MEIKFFDDTLEKFIMALEPPTVAKILRTIDLLEKFGNALGLPHSKKIGPQMFELRVRGKQEVRILYTFYMNAAVLLHGFMKKADRISRKDLKAAHRKIKALDII